MRPIRRENGDTLHVTIVADNPETIDGLQTYLRRAGLSTRGIREIEKSSDSTVPPCAVVIIFPDDFRIDAVAVALAELRAERPHALQVLVTREPKRFATLSRGNGVAALVVPKPAWGWTILEAIRDRLEFE